MTPKETALILRLHNAWRRGYENAPNMTEPKLLGEAIDSAVALIEQRDELLAALERMLRSYRVLKPVGYPLSDAEKIAESAIASVKGGA